MNEILGRSYMIRPIGRASVGGLMVWRTALPGLSIPQADNLYEISAARALAIHNVYFRERGS